MISIGDRKATAADRLVSVRRVRNLGEGVKGERDEARGVVVWAVDGSEWWTGGGWLTE